MLAHKPDRERERDLSSSDKSYVPLLSHAMSLPPIDHFIYLHCRWLPLLLGMNIIELSTLNICVGLL
ncbi:hypothetical protein BgiBS90_013018, partial [Biomphalaria glabrata]